MDFDELLRKQRESDSDVDHRGRYPAVSAISVRRRDRPRTAGTCDVDQIGSHDFRVGTTLGIIIGRLRKGGTFLAWARVLHQPKAEVYNSNRTSPANASARVRHPKAGSLYRIEPGSKHGNRTVLHSEAVLMEPPKTAGDVRDVLADTMSQLHSRKMDVRIANSLAYISTPSCVLSKCPIWRGG
jgi:hypothetical protein